MNLPEGVLAAASRRGRRVRDAAARADLLLASGPRYVVRHLSDERRARAGETAASDGVYAELWAQAAAECGAELTPLPGGIIELRRGERRTRVWRQWVQLDDNVTIRAALDRTLVHRALEGEGLPVPENLTVRVDDLTPGIEFLEQHGCVVVKPASGTGGGRGATAGVRTPTQLRRAAVMASRHDHELILERQAAGHVYRFLFLDGELLDIVRRLPPHVTGDGRSDIRGLVLAENRRRLDARGHAGLPLVTANLDMLFTLEHAGLALDSVLESGRRVAVKTVTNQSGPADNQTVRVPVADQLVGDARRAAAAVGVRLAGVDLITPDLGGSLAEAGGVVIEVNGGPGLHHHYHVADREAATRVCVPILEYLLNQPA
jgi:D-alanine-D-alanine ligase-like ATP-grasp enzyme